MTRRTDAHPDMTRPEVEAPFFSTWRVGTPERQKVTVEAIASTWESRPWPTEGLLGYYVYTGHDGTTLLHHSQWADEQSYEAFAKTHRQERVDEIDTAVPGIERLSLGRYRRYRSRERAAGDTRTPGLIVTVRIDFEGSEGFEGFEGFEGEAAERRRDWVDSVFTAMSAAPEDDRGLVAAHFHLSTDGTHVLNYAEWESEQSYDEALAVSEPAPEWEAVRTAPGVKFTGSRYSYALGLVPQ
ncbi:hypothetical protein G5C60_07060 [Streptomyces sp. HC44]|uniref:Uncharacterized protein n=1 Tax=Streptomyces scabichelini TaxID=2711217 RepID=A0A6G4V046_9ACTN|nr:antibiotic biosynthesis monooxygenase [Streptomyces scabichelini]NGO07418.1 hypothetical protein [Streptomyces scabichelini]